MESHHLPELAKQLLAQARSARAGRAAHSLHGGSQHMLRQTITALCAGQELAEHNSPVEATLHVLEGHVKLAWEDQTWQGRSGDLVQIPRDRHSLQAIEDSVFLLTVVVPH